MAEPGDIAWRNNVDISRCLVERKGVTEVSCLYDHLPRIEYFKAHDSTMKQWRAKSIDSPLDKSAAIALGFGT